MVALSSRVGSTLGQLDRATRRLGVWRLAPAGQTTATGSYKEWMHFCVGLGRVPDGVDSPDGHLLINFSSTERQLATGPVRVPRVIVMAHCGSTWTGFVEEFEMQAIKGEAGGVHAAFGPNTMSWEWDAFAVRFAVGGLTGDLRLYPRMLPSVTSSVAFEGGRAMQWTTIPRLEASGWVGIDGQQVFVDRQPAYHDHNWGDFLWGEDLTWDWGYVLPDSPACPWSVVFARVSDRCRIRTLSQGVFLWCDDRHVRTFQAGELEVTLQGRHVSARPFTLPPVAGLLRPGAASGVPESLTLKARGLNDQLKLTFATQSTARVVIPSDRDPLSSTVLSEAVGRATVRGCVGEHDLQFEGAAIVEFARA